MNVQTEGMSAVPSTAAAMETAPATAALGLSCCAQASLNRRGDVGIAEIPDIARRNIVVLY